MATGRTIGGRRFTRETTRTFAVGDPDLRPGGTGDQGGRADDTLCRLLMCLLGDAGIQRLLDEHHIDVKRLATCLRELCAPDVPERGRAGVRNSPG